MDFSYIEVLTSTIPGSLKNQVQHPLLSILYLVKKVEQEA
jgi:hypothetical protein